MRSRVTAIQVFSLLVTAAWLTSLVVRVHSPDTSAAFTSVDTAELLILGYYFVARSVRNHRGGSSE